jgi:hypothetical protein
LVISLTATVAMTITGGALVPASASAPLSGQSLAERFKGLSVAARVFDAADPGESYRRLSPADRTSFDAVETPASVQVQIALEGLGSNRGRTSPSVAAATDGTWSMRGQWSYHSIAGNTLFTYGDQVTIKVSGRQVTAVSVINVYSETSTPGWYQNGPNTTATYNAGWEGRGRMQTNYALGVNGWNIQHVTPCGQIRLNADGLHYLGNSNCSLS